jgi:2-oxoglutarate ferredoxin oxidoreductase subunit alpha
LATPRLMQGNTAIALGALDAGCNFFAGYPITPSTEIAEMMSAELPKRGGKFIQMEDEIASLGAVIGASIAGSKAMTATSGPGFSLMQENLGFAYMTEIPCVIVDVMRGGPSTGLPTLPSQSDVMQTRWGTHGDHAAVVLCPSSVLECYEITVRAFNLSEKYRMPVIVLTDEVIAHMREVVTLPDEIEVYDGDVPDVPAEWYKPYDESPSGVTPLAAFGTGYRFHITGLTHDRKGFSTTKPAEVEECVRRLTEKVEKHRQDIIDIEHDHLKGADVAVIAYGITARSARAAVRQARDEGYRVGFVNLKTIWPFPDKLLSKVAEKTKVFVVPEMNAGQAVLRVGRMVRCADKVVPVNRFDGQVITPEEILEAIRANTVKRRAPGKKTKKAARK